MQKALWGASSIPLFTDEEDSIKHCRSRKADVKFDGDTVYVRIGEISGSGMTVSEALNDRYLKLAQVVEDEAVKNLETLPRPYFVKIARALMEGLTEEELNGK